jgi:pimeloyl-ACP methyl ester carboxylesterase
MRWPGQLLLCLVLILGWLSPLQHVAGAQEPVAMPDLSRVSLTPNSCDFLIQGSDDPRERLGNIACGTLDMPENWSLPDARRIQIGYLVLKSTAAPLPDPVVYLAGGPGSSPLTSGEVWARFFAGLRQERDVVFLDQRGTRLSSPLRCEAYTRLMALALPPEVDDTAGSLAVPTYPSDITNADDLLQTAREQYGPAADECVQQLEAQGVDLTQYNSIASANDAIALVKALGYDEFNLYGISYGTRLALEVMRNHSESGLRSVVLDSTYPPEIRTYEQLAVSSHEVALRLFSDCERDAACKAAYPDLKQRFIALLAQLHVEPVVAGDGSSITDQDLINVMHSLTSRVEIVPYVPLLIAELERGEDATYLGITGGSLFAPPNNPADASATPQMDAAPEAAPDTLELDDASTARAFVLAMQTELDAVGGDAAEQGTLGLIELDAMTHDQQSLQDFVDQAFSQPEQDELRGSFQVAIAEMNDAEIREAFSIIEQTITLEDSSIAGQTVPQYYSIECNERMPFQSFGRLVAITQQVEIPELALGKPEALAKVFAICEEWPSGRAPEVEHEPVASEVPTLILAGAYDNLTPTTWNKSAFVNLPNGTFFLAPMSGHAVITYSACAEQIGQDFIADPVAPLDTTCLVDLAPRWVLPPA